MFFKLMNKKLYSFHANAPGKVLMTETTCHTVSKGKILLQHFYSQGALLHGISWFSLNTVI